MSYNRDIKYLLIMKNLILTLILSLVSTILFSQTSLDIYVVSNQGTGVPECPFGLVDTWSSQAGAGNMTLISQDSIFGSPVYHYEIPDTTYPILVTICLYVGSQQPPFPPQTPNCATFTVNGPMMAYTIVADCGQLQIEEIVTEDKIVSITNLLGQPISWKQEELMIVKFSNGTYKKLFVNK